MRPQGQSRPLECWACRGQREWMKHGGTERDAPLPLRVAAPPGWPAAGNTASAWRRELWSGRHRTPPRWRGRSTRLCVVCWSCSWVRPHLRFAFLFRGAGRERAGDVGSEGSPQLVGHVPGDTCQVHGGEIVIAGFVFRNLGDDWRDIAQIQYAAQEFPLAIPGDILLHRQEHGSVKWPPLSRPFFDRNKLRIGGADLKFGAGAAAPPLPAAWCALRAPILRSSASIIVEPKTANSGRNALNSGGLGAAPPITTTLSFRIDLRVMAAHLHSGRGPPAAGTPSSGAAARNCRTGGSGRCPPAPPVPSGSPASTPLRTSASATSAR